MHSGSVRKRRKQAVDKGREGVCFFDSRKERRPLPHWLRELTCVHCGCERKSGKQLTKAERVCAFFDSRKGKKACASLAEGAEMRALWL